MILLTLLLVCSGIALAAEERDSSESAGSAAALSAPPQDPPGPEIAAERTATSQTFQLPDGSRETRIFETPIHYKNPEGEWKPIEEGFGSDGVAALTNGANSFDVSLPAQMGAGPVRLTEGNRWVAMRLLGERTETAELQDGGETATYEAGAGTSFELSSLGNGLKEEIEIAAPSAPSTFRFELSASAGVVPSKVEDGSIELRDEDRELVATLPAPTIADSSGAPPALGAIHYEMEPQGEGRWALAVEADPDWLHAPERTWPIRIDPSIVTKNPSLDCAIFNGAYSEMNLCGSSGWPYLGAKAKYLANNQDEFARTLLRFDLSAIPTKASVQSASIGLYSASAAKNTSGVQLWRVTKDWNGTVSWLNYKKDGGGPKPWTTPGGDFAPEVSEILTSQRGSQAGWWQFNVRQIAQKWIRADYPDLNYGVLAKLSDESQHTCSPSCIERFVEFSSSAATAAQRPYLSVTYYPSAPADSKVVSPTDGIRTARRLKLKAAWTAAGVTGVTFQAKYTGSGQYFETIPPGLVTNAQGQQITWPVAVSGVKASEPLYLDAANLTPELWAVGGKVEIRAVFEGPTGVEGFSTPVTATVDRATGGPRDAVAEVGPGTVNLLTGNLTVSRTDVSIPAFGSALEFSRHPQLP